MDFITRPSWLLFALLFFGFLIFVSWQRRMDKKWIQDRLGHRRILIESFGVIFFGLTSDSAPPRRIKGVLVLLADGLFFGRRVGLKNLDIPGDKIIRVYHDTVHKGVDIKQSLVKIDFLNELDNEDSAAFHVPYPPEWIKAIKEVFELSQPSDDETVDPEE
jgi:hypothetical protein